MGYQNGPRTITLTQDGTPVEWITDYENKRFHVYINGLHYGGFPTRQAAIETLHLVVVPAK